MTSLEKAEIGKLRSLPRKPLKSDPADGPFTGPIIRTVKINGGKTSGIDVRHGTALNESMIRIDVFQQKSNGRYHVVPLYVHHRVAKQLPQHAIVAAKDESEWTLIDDDGFEFGYVEVGGVADVGLAGCHGDDLVTFKFEAVVGEGFRYDDG